MTNEPKRHTPGWFTATVVVLVLLGVCVGGYFVLGEYRYSRGVRRDFASKALMLAYCPMGWVECRARGEIVVLGTDSQHHIRRFRPAP